MADISKIKKKSTQAEYNIKDATARSSISTIEGKIPSNASTSNKLATASDITDVYEVMGKNGAKNLLVPAPTETKMDVTFTTNADGTVTVNGTPNDESGAYHDLLLATDLRDLLDKYGDLIVSGTPSATASNLRIITQLSDDTFLTDNGNGIFLDASESYKLGLIIQVFHGYTADDVVFSPMVRLASDSDDTYVPYTLTNKELTDNKADLDANGKVKSSELPIASTSNLGAVKVDGTTVTINASGVISSSGGGGGTTVVPNPSGTATADLTKVQIGSDIYDIQGGGSTVSIAETGTASASSTSKQQLTIDGVNTDINGTKYMEQNITLSTSATTTATFTSSEIKSDSVIEVFAGRSTGDVQGAKNQFPYDSVYTTNGSCVVTFPQESSAITITVRIYIRG